MFRDIFHIDDAFRDYINNRLLPQLGCSQAGCTVEAPLSGRKSCIRMVKVGDGRGYAVRAFYKNNTGVARQLYLADDLLEKHKIPAPRLVDFAERYSSGGVTFVAEEYLDGQIWGEKEPTVDLVRRLGKLLARLHSVESGRWGPLAREKSPRGTFGASQLRRVRHRIHRVKKFAPDTVSGSEFRAVREWFRAFRPRLDGIKAFQLIHDKINKGNVFYSPDKPKLYLLDFATLQYGCRVKDLVQTEHEMLGNDKNLSPIFLEEYFSNFPTEVKEKFDKLSTFYRAYYHLSRSASNIRRDYTNRTRRHIFKAAHYDNFLRHWRSLWAIIEGSANKQNSSQKTTTG